MKLLIIVVLILLVTIPPVLAHPVITHTHPGQLTSNAAESLDTKIFQRDFFTILIGAIVVTMSITVFVVYREEITLSIRKYSSLLVKPNL